MDFKNMAYKFENVILLFKQPRSEHKENYYFAFYERLPCAPYANCSFSSIFYPFLETEIVISQGIFESRQLIIQPFDTEL